MVFFFFFSDFSFNSELKKKKPHAKWLRLVGLMETVTETVMESWIDKNWKLEDWIDKIEK